VDTQNRPFIDTSKPAMSWWPSTATLTSTRSLCSSDDMGNVSETHRQQQVVALGRLGWPFRRIERETSVRHETASEYLKPRAFPSAGAGDQEKTRGTDPGHRPRRAPRRRVRVCRIATESKLR
jgi:hypothetical protein